LRPEICIVSQGFISLVYVGKVDLSVLQKLPASDDEKGITESKNITAMIMIETDALIFHSKMGATILAWLV